MCVAGVTDNCSFKILQDNKKMHMWDWKFIFINYVLNSRFMPLSHIPNTYSRRCSHGFTSILTTLTTKDDNCRINMNNICPEIEVRPPRSMQLSSMHARHGRHFWGELDGREVIRARGQPASRLWIFIACESVRAGLRTCSIHVVFPLSYIVQGGILYTTHEKELRIT